MAWSRDDASSLHTGKGGCAGTLVQGPWSKSCLAVAVPGAVNDAQGLEVDLVSSSSGVTIVSESGEGTHFSPADGKGDGRSQLIGGGCFGST